MTEPFPIPIRDEIFTIRTWDVDRSDRLTLAGAFNFWQEVAGSHAEELGVGSSAFRGQGLAWILSRMSAEILERPMRTEQVLVRTWPRGINRLFAVRDYEIRGESDRLLARGRSGWLIIDLASLRPRRPESFVTDLPLNEGRDALADGAGGLEKRGDLSATGTRIAAYSDIDYNGHVNNARYIQWLQDLIDPLELEAAGGLRLDINYLSEVKIAALVDFFAGPLPLTSAWTKRYAFEGRLADNGTAAFRAELGIS